MAVDDLAYAQLLDSGREPPEACCICTGDDDAPPCSEECEAILARAERCAARKRDLKAFRSALRRAIELARQYRSEGDTATSMRLYGALKAVRFYRKQIQLTRASELADVPFTEERQAAE